MKIRGRLFRVLKKLVRYAAHLRGFKTVPWVVHWEITHQCNLHCKYCAVPKSKTHGNTQNGLSKIIEMAPKHLIISGGEPFLISDIAEMTREIREKIHPYVMLTTNLMVKPERVCATIPYLDQLHFSIDGTGDLNKINRGVSGDEILRRLEKIVPAVEKERKHRKYPLTALCVLTRDNWENLDQLERSVHEIDPDTRLTLATVEPIDSPLSLINEPEILKSLLPQLSELQKTTNLSSVGPLGAALVQWEKKETDSDNTGSCVPVPYFCPRQFFRVMMNPDGEVHLCKPDRYIDYCFSKGKKHLLSGEWVKGVSEFSYLMKTLFIHPYDTYCPFPCKCEEFVDELIRNSEGEEVPEREFLLQGYFTDEELSDAENFIRNYFNPNWNSLLIEEFREKNKNLRDKSPH